MSKPKKKKKFDQNKMIPPKKQRGGFSIPLHHLIAIGLIVGVALVAYSNTFYVPFNFDDWPNITMNPNIQIKALTIERIGQLIKNIYRENIRIFSYLTLALNYYFGDLHVFGYHLVNFFIHISSGIFLYWFLMMTFNLHSLKERYGSISYKISLFTSLIFISHPIQTQSVTYIVQRMSSMAGMFYLLSMALYVKGRLTSGKGRFLYLGGTVLSWLLGISSKENAAILPLFIALYEFYFFQNLDLSPRGRKVLFSLVAALLILGAFGFIIWGQRYINVIIEGYQYRTFTMSERVLTQFRVVLYYVTLLIYPHPSRLNLDYDFLISKTIFDPPTTLLSILIVAGLIGYSIWMARKRPVLSFFILWYFGNLVIESSIFPLEMVYEHRLYLPAIGPFVLFGLLTMRGREKLKGRVFGALGWSLLFFIIIFLSMGTYQRNGLWNNQIEFWNDCIKKSPQKERVHHNLGYVYLELGRLDEAKEKFEEASRLNPHYALSMYNLGLVFYKKGLLDEAIVHYKKAIELDPNIPEPYYNLGIAYYEKGFYYEAIELYKKFLEAKPEYENANFRLGLAYGALKKWVEATASFQEELKYCPNNFYAHIYLGRAYMELEDYPKALFHLKKVLTFPNVPNVEGIREAISVIEANQRK
jgi:cytochrome c-type biogenesis protein CcmH/NrfG